MLSASVAVSALSFKTRYVVINLTFADRQGTGLWSGAQYGEDCGEVVLWDIRSGQDRRRFACSDVLMDMAVFSDYSQIAIEPYGGLWLLNAKTLEVEKRFNFTEGDVDFRPLHSQKFVSCSDSDSPGDDPRNLYAVRVWDVETGTLLLTLKGHTNNIHAAAFSRDERLLASGDENGRVNVWNISQLHP